MSLEIHHLDNFSYQCIFHNKENLVVLNIPPPWPQLMDRFINTFTVKLKSRQRKIVYYNRCCYIWMECNTKCNKVYCSKLSLLYLALSYSTIGIQSTKKTGYSDIEYTILISKRAVSERTHKRGHKAKA